MDNNIVSTEDLARLWDRYVEASKQYRLAKQATDAAEAACRAAYESCEAAYAKEVKCAQVVARASQEFRTATDAAFLIEIGVSPC
jgi:hypothetical protein